MISYKKAEFLISSPKLSLLPPDEGFEVAFAGRSNAGKSSVLNCLTQNKNLARTSKTPGRTQLINLFTLDEQRRLVDLPGYGFAKVSLKVKEQWQANLSEYLEKRGCLKGLVVLMDIRHPMKEIDQMIVQWCIESELPCHILLNKSDKLKRNAQMSTLAKTREQLREYQHLISIQTFSALKKQGLDQLVAQLNRWYEVSADKKAD